MRLGFAVVMALLSVVPATAGEIDRLGWMAGSWSGTKDGVEMEEHWTAPRGGWMLGMHRDVRGGRGVSFEFFRIAEDSLGLVYLSQPRGMPVTPFRAKSVEARRVVFENAAHDFPQRILYWVERGALHARIEGEIGGKTESEEWVWKPARL